MKQIKYCSFNFLIFIAILNFVNSFNLFAEQNNSVEINLNQGNTFENVSLINRFNGVKKVIIARPLILSQLDEVVFDNIYNYFNNKGILVEFIKIPYDKEDWNTGKVRGIIKHPQSYDFDFLKDSNTLILTISYRLAENYYAKRFDMKLYILDLLGKNIWDIEIENLKVDTSKKIIDKKFFKKLDQSFPKEYSYNLDFSVKPDIYYCNWNEEKLNNYLSTNSTKELEGIYAFSNERIGIKFDENKNTYVGFYISGNDFDGWVEGNLKFVLEAYTNTLSMNGIWIDSYFRQLNILSSFENGKLIIFEDENKPLIGIKLGSSNK